MSQKAEMCRGCVFCERILISPWSMYITILIILPVLQLCIFNQMLSLPLFFKRFYWGRGTGLYWRIVCTSRTFFFFFQVKLLSFQSQLWRAQLSSRSSCRFLLQRAQPSPSLAGVEELNWQPCG
ncbi:hypothetical protein mRhiFer1_010256 [Rhinolophus ferrumequinum]|uniref:Uncharacterized protein n=1 Tax=Rhinolophus ferrumequinum TaxID=59479 RepID=A0A7J7X6E7_RHIFE|nr:hypothetical protein mRhiFer1_010256 [Rhinolophus ferrumequinum]